MSYLSSELWSWPTYVMTITVFFPLKENWIWKANWTICLWLIIFEISSTCNKKTRKSHHSSWKTLNLLFVCFKISSTVTGERVELELRWADTGKLTVPRWGARKSRKYVVTWHGVLRGRREGHQIGDIFENTDRLQVICCYSKDNKEASIQWEYFVCCLYHIV